MSILKIARAMDYIDDDLVSGASEYKRAKKKNTWIKWGALAACLCLCFCFTVPALAAAGHDLAYEVLYSISPSIAQKLKPVNASCEDNGIEMTVVAAEVNGDEVNILVSMRDNTGERLDETTDLFDSCSIHTPYDQSCGCSLVSYDDETNTATFMLTIEQMNHMLIPGDKITFSVSQLLSKKEHSNFKLAQIKTEDVRLITEFVTNPVVRGGGGSDIKSIDWDNLLFMKTDEANAIDLTNGVTLTGYGIVDGKLHIQLRYNDILNTDNHGYVYLKTQDDKVIICENNYAFWDENHINSYEEYVFSVSAEGLADYEIWGEFWTCNNGPIKGNWQVTFPMAGKE